MSIALVLDFPGSTRRQYDEVVERMHLDGRMAPGGLVHVAGSYGGGWRVIDVWEDAEHFERFRDEQITPHTQATGMGTPQVRMLHVEEEKPGSGAEPALVQYVILPGLHRAEFQAADRKILPTGDPPTAVTFHVNGPVEGGWCVIDGWTSKEARDRFLDERVRPAFETIALQGPPQIEDLMVEAMLLERPAARV
jgi:quinol monooxygenase YgiN